LKLKATATLDAPAFTKLELRDLADGSTFELEAAKSKPLAPGSYLAKWVNTNTGVTMQREHIRIQPRDKFVFRPDSLREKPVLASIIKNVPRTAIGADDRSIDFSETLGGAVVDRDPGLWLAILGASRIVADPASFSKLGKFQLQSFAKVKPGTAPVYL